MQWIKTVPSTKCISSSVEKDFAVHSSYEMERCLFRFEFESNDKVRLQHELLQLPTTFYFPYKYLYLLYTQISSYYLSMWFLVYWRSHARKEFRRRRRYEKCTVRTNQWLALHDYWNFDAQTFQLKNVRERKRTSIIAMLHDFVVLYFVWSWKVTSIQTYLFV